MHMRLAWEMSGNKEVNPGMRAWMLGGSMERPLGALRQDGLLGKVGCGQLEMASSELRDSGTHRAGSDDSQVPGSSRCEAH